MDHAQTNAQLWAYTSFSLKDIFSHYVIQYLTYRCPSLLDIIFRKVLLYSGFVVATVTVSAEYVGLWNIHSTCDTHWEDAVSWIWTLLSVSVWMFTVPQKKIEYCSSLVGMVLSPLTNCPPVWMVNQQYRQLRNGFSYPQLNIWTPASPYKTQHAVVSETQLLFHNTYPN